MISRKTVFVVGAGASAEFGLPTGPRLAEIIANRLDIRHDDWGRRLVSGDQHLWDSIWHTQSADQVNDLQKACWLIRDGVGLAYSIDSFLDAHRANTHAQLCGRLAIVKSILQAEAESSLAFDASRREDADLDFRANGDKWVAHLFRMLQEGVDRSRADTLLANTSFVVFNYDRCIEHFLYRAVRRFYNLRDDEAASVLSKCEVVHLYGSVGRLPWQEAGPNGSRTSFGDERANLPALRSGVFTYTDQLTDDRGVRRARDLLAAADTVAFLGFAFHRQNMELLSLRAFLDARRILATTWGMSEFQRREVEAEIGTCLRTSKANKLLVVEDGKCADLISRYTGAFAD